MNNFNIADKPIDSYTAQYHIPSLYGNHINRTFGAIPWRYSLTKTVTTSEGKCRLLAYRHF